jgi:hypothetical protein
VGVQKLHEISVLYLTNITNYSISFIDCLYNLIVLRHFLHLNFIFINQVKVRFSIPQIARVNAPPEKIFIEAPAGAQT